MEIVMLCFYVKERNQLVISIKNSFRLYPGISHNGFMYIKSIMFDRT